MIEPTPKTILAAVLATVRGFIDTCPDLKGTDIKFGDVLAGESDLVQMMDVTFDGVKYFVLVKKVGG